MQKCQLIELQEPLERYSEVLPVFPFNSAKYDLMVLKSYFLPILVNERHIGPTLIKKKNQFTSFKFGDIQLLDILNFLGGATILELFLKACNNSETKGFFPYLLMVWWPDNVQCRIQNFLPVTLFTVNFEASILLRPRTRNMLI